MQSFHRIRHIAAIAAVLLSAPIAAAPVFPPPHLSPGATFSPGTAAAGDASEAWYHRGDGNRRAQRIAGEAKQVSPYPSLYYFINIRNYANDESARLNSIRAGGTVTGEVIVDVPSDAPNPG